MSKYSGAENTASSAFILFVLSWIILRLIYYPFWIIWSTRYVSLKLLLLCINHIVFAQVKNYLLKGIIINCSYEVLQVVDKEKHPVDGPLCFYIFNTLLICLLVMHIYWWVLMYRMLVKQIQSRGKLSDDVRSGKYRSFCIQTGGMLEQF